MKPEEILGEAEPLHATRRVAAGPSGRLPINEEMLVNEPSGNLFGLTQNAGMGWSPEEVNRPAYLILTNMGGLRDQNGQPIALGYHTGHWELGLLLREAAETLSAQAALPFAAYVSDPCDGRSQGTPGMFDSLAYRNDAAIVMRRLIRSLPTCQGVIGIASCDKGLPATMMALAGEKALPGIVIPGGVTLPARGAEDLGKIQTIGARFAHDMISLDYAAEMGCRACGSGGGGCQFLGTAATAQVVAEGLGMTLPHSALIPSGEPVWIDMARRSALAVLHMKEDGITLTNILTPAAIENAMILHAAFGGSTNLLLHLPAVAHAAGLNRPTVDDWIRASRSTPRLVDVLPNGPHGYPTVDVFMAGGVPEVMLHLRQLGLLNLQVMTASGQTLAAVLEWWEQSERRQVSRQALISAGIDPDQVILNPQTARQMGLTGTLIFPIGNLAPQGSVVKATSIDPSVINQEGVYRCRGRARVFTSEHAAIRAIKGQSKEPVQPGDVLVYIGGGPLGSGMEETYQLTSALKYLPGGKHIPLITDARFSGVSTGACIGHIGPEALAGGPIGRLRDGDIIEIVIDRNALAGQVNLVGTETDTLTPDEAVQLLHKRELHPDLHPHPDLPEDTRLWATLQSVSGGTWGGSVYDIDQIVNTLEAGERVLKQTRLESGNE